MRHDRGTEAIDQKRETGWWLRTRDIRFLMTGVFPAGVLLTAGAWGEHLGWAVLLSLILSLSFIPFLTGITRVSSWTLMPILVALVLTIAYPVKTYFFAFATWDAKGLGPLAFVLSGAPILSRQTLYEAYKLGILGLVTFLLVASLLMNVWRKPRPVLEWTARVNPHKMIPLLWLVLVITLSILTGLNLLALKLGILRMGIESQRLPFRLGGAILLTRAFLGSNVLLLILFFGLTFRVKRIVAATVFAFVYAALMAAIVSASRGVILLSLAPPIWLAMITGHLRVRWLFRPKNMALAIILIAIFALTHPLITYFRVETTERKVSDSEALQGAASLLFDQMKEDPIAVVTGAVTTIVARIVGTENLIISLESLGVPDRGEIWRSVMSRGELMAVYYTREVMGYDTYDFQITPGLVALFWFLGGSLYVIAGMVLFTLFVFGLNWICHARPFRVSHPVFVAMLAPGMAILSSEGTLQQALSVESLLFLLLSLAMTEVTARWMILFSHSRRHGSQSQYAPSCIVA